MLSALNVIKMKYLRYPPLIFWLLCSALLASLLLTANNLSNTVEYSKETSDYVNPIKQVELIRASTAQLPYLTIAPYTGLAEWSIANKDLANKLILDRSKAGYSTSDPISAKLAQISSESEQLFHLVGTADHMSILAKTAKIGILTDSLVNIASTGGVLNVPLTNPVGNIGDSGIISKPGESPKAIDPVNPAGV